MKGALWAQKGVLGSFCVLRGRGVEVRVSAFGSSERRGLGFGVWGLGFRVLGFGVLGFGVWGFGF